MRRRPLTFTRESKLAEYGPGPWVDEPDQLTWEEPGTMIGRLVRRTEMGALCGYIALPRLHPWSGRRDGDIPAQVHGGVTFADDGDTLSIPGDARWTVGFDCVHYMDLWPAMAKRYKEAGIEQNQDPDSPFKVEYRDLTYVKKEIEDLALQALIVPAFVKFRLLDAAARSPHKKRKARVYAALAKRIGNRRLPWSGAREKMMRKTFATSRALRGIKECVTVSAPPGPIPVPTQEALESLAKFAGDWLRKSLSDPEQ